MYVSILVLTRQRPVGALLLRLEESVLGPNVSGFSGSRRFIPVG